MLAITPFNFPLNLAAHKVRRALAAGCPVILKPAPQAPFTALALGEVLKAGWPEEAPGRARRNDNPHGLAPEKRTASAGQLYRLGQGGMGAEGALRTQARAVRVGRQRHAHRAQRLERFGRRGIAHRALGLYTQGSACISTQRVFVERSIFQTFLWKVVEVAAKLVVGDPSNEATEVGPLLSG